MRTTSEILLLSLLALAMPASILSQTPPAPGPPVELLPIPFPDLNGLEPTVAQQLTDTRNLLQKIFAEPGADHSNLWQTYGELGQVYHAYALEEAARACYVNAHRLNPRDFRWPYLLGTLEQQAGRLEEADAYYAKALAIRPDYVALRVRLGELYLAQNRLEEARAQLDEAIGFDPSCTAAYAVLGELALAEGKHQEAIDVLEQVLAQVPAANRFHYPLGMAYRTLGDMDKAREHLAARGVVGIQPPDPLLEQLEDLKRGERVYLLRGRMAFNAGRFRDAAEAFAAAVAARPESGRARVNLGTALASAGDRDGALREFREALKLDPGNAAAHYNLGALLAQGGDADAATTHLQAAIAADPRDVGAHLELARLWRRGGQLEDARRLYAKVVELDPLNEEGRLGEASMLVGLGRFEDARERLVQAHEIEPAWGLTAHALARFLAASPRLDLRDGTRALDLAGRVYEAQPTVEHARTVALALAELGRCDEAADWQRRAVEAVVEAGQEERAGALREILARYESERPCRPPGEGPPEG